MSSMGEVSSEGEGQYQDWLMEHLSAEGVAFVEYMRDARVISDDQARLLMEEAEAILGEDPYGIEAYVSPWEAAHVERVYLVSAYHQSRRYGGAEEGGWWYDHHDPLTNAYAESHGRSFIIAGPFRDRDDASEVASKLNACEWAGYTRNMPPSIVWRVQASVPFTPNPLRYC